MASFVQLMMLTKIFTDHQHWCGTARPFGLHLLNAAVDMRLFPILEARNAYAANHQFDRFFRHSHSVTDNARVALGCSQTSRADPTRQFYLPVFESCWLRHNPTVFPTLIDDEMLD